MIFILIQLKEGIINLNFIISINNVIIYIFINISENFYYY